MPVDERTTLSLSQPLILSLSLSLFVSKPPKKDPGSRLNLRRIASWGSGYSVLLSLLLSPTPSYRVVR